MKEMFNCRDYEKIEAEIGAVSLLIQGHHENKKHLGLKIRDKKLQLDKIHGRLTALKRRREQLGTGKLFSSFLAFYLLTLLHDLGWNVIFRTEIPSER